MLSAEGQTGSEAGAHGMATGLLFLVAWDYLKIMLQLQATKVS